MGQGLQNHKAVLPKHAHARFVDAPTASGFSPRQRYFVFLIEMIDDGDDG